MIFRSNEVIMMKHSKGKLFKRFTFHFSSICIFGTLPILGFYHRKNENLVHIDDVT